ncbi:MAG: helix-turn-helix domain-containing protein, partial [Proteobacteria bacterium]
MEVNLGALPLHVSANTVYRVRQRFAEEGVE